MAAQTSPDADIALSLALAVIASSGASLLVLDGDLVVIAASTPFCRAFQLDGTNAGDGPLFQLGSVEWNVPELHSLLEATASGDGSVARADVVNLGLVVTELVSNARKHAFSEERGDKISVGLRSHDFNWTLFVNDNGINDNGIGMARDAESVKLGQGTSSRCPRLPSPAFHATDEAAAAAPA